MLLDVISSGGVLFESPDVALAGQGELSRLELPFRYTSVRESVREVVADLRRHGEDAIAFVSIPFAESKSVLSVVPETVLRSSHLLSTADKADLPTDFSVEPSRSPKEWRDAVYEAISRIRRGDLDKVVLARQVDVEADRAFDIAAVVANLRASYASAYRFAIDGLVGASPELLISRTGLDIRSYPLAGTRANSGDATSASTARNELLSSDKDQNEHSYLSHSVEAILAPLCSELNVDPHPGVLSVGNVQHLATNVAGVLRDPSTTALDLVAALHPTPAVGGTPTDKALALIAELEQMDRGRYAGAVGWINAHGDGCFAVAIRCAQIEGNVAHLFAGNGIVAQSDPALEFEESQWKLQPMLNALVRP